MKRTGVMVLLAMMVVVAGCAGGGAEEAAGGGGQRAQTDESGPQRAAADGEADMAAPEEGDGADDVAAAGEGGAVTAATLAAVGERVVRDGTLRMRVGAGAFDGAFDELVGLAGRFGGTVLASDATTADDGSTSGTVTIKVPTEDFDALLVAVGQVGEIEQRSITSEDVSGEFIDLEARLRHNRAQERFYLSLLDRADDVEDAIAVQQRVEGIQQTIERIEGRLRFLEDRTSFSRLTVEVFEAGGAYQPGGSPAPSFARYWATARAALVTVLGGALVVATVALPFLLTGAIILVVVRRHGTARRRTATPEA
ncbi:MAG TPA: DUF4349 domain-containing protein [Euzebyales bacterium]